MGKIPIFDTETNLPPRLGAFELVATEVYPDERFGVRIRYSGADDTKADVYLYNLGLEKIPDDIRSDEARELFQAACDEVFLAAQQGIYRNLELMTSEYLHIPEDAPDPMWMWTAFRYRQAPNPFTKSEWDRISHLALRTDRGYINKVRYTCNGQRGEESFGEFLVFLYEWWQAVRGVSSQDSADAVTPAGPDSGLRRELISRLHSSRPPHPFGFFNLMLEIEKERQAAAAIFNSQGNEGGEGDAEREPQDLIVNVRVAESVHHEIAHAIYNILETEMAISIDFAGFPRRIDLRPPKRDGRDEDDPQG